MHTHDTLSSQTEGNSRGRLALGGGFVVAASLALMTLAVAPAQGQGQSVAQPIWSQAVHFVETPALRDIGEVPMTPEEIARREARKEAKEKNKPNTMRVKRQNPFNVAPFIDFAINNTKYGTPFAVTPPIANFDGVDADAGSVVFGGRTAPPDTNGAVGPNHYVLTTNLGLQVYNKSGVPAGPVIRLSQLLVGIPNAADDDGDPVVLYDSLADRWVLMQFNLRVTQPQNTTHTHIAVSKTGDPTGAYWAYDFLGNPGRAGDYPHTAVWPDGYYMSTNDFTPPLQAPFLGASCYAMERSKMLVGDPTAQIIGFPLSTAHGGMLPTNLQGLTAPPEGTPNLFFEFADISFDMEDLFFQFAFHADFVTPANSTLTETNFLVGGFDARNPTGRNHMLQPPPSTITDALDSISDRFMHPINFRVLPGGIQSFVMNFTVNVSGVNPTSATNYQGGVRWLELRRNPGTGDMTVNNEATYAPGAGNGATGRDLWMASVAQDGEGNIALAASATDALLLTPTAIYTGRLAGDPPNTLPQSEVDPMTALTRGVQTGTGNRWGDYSSLFVDPADDCTFWGAFEYVDAPTASFDWNTRIFSFKVNPACVTAPRGTINGTITSCAGGTPIQDAVISTPDGHVRQTIANGTFSMTVSPGNYLVRVIGAPGSGFGTCFENVTVPPGGTVTVNCCLGQGSPTPIPSATPSPSVSPTPTPTPSPTPSASPIPTPSPTPRAQAINISTRMRVETGNNVGIGGFIIGDITSGGGDGDSTTKHVLIRAIGPSLARFGIPNVLADPVLELHGPSGLIASNNNWRDTQEMVIQATGIPPTNDLESAIDATLEPGSYTAIIRGNGNTSGVGLVEVYDLDEVATDAKLSNISTRAFVSTAGNVVIAGFILHGGGDDEVIIRGLGPSLSAAGLSPVLANPTLELRNSDGTLLVSNNDWQDNAAQVVEIAEAGLQPPNSLESAIFASLGPGVYTALLAGLNNGTGLGLIEVYDRGDGSGAPAPSPSPTPPGGGTPTPTPPGGGTPTPTPPGGGTPTPTPPGGGTPTPTPPPPASPTPSPPSGPCTENFDGVTAPTLPAGWTANNAEGPAPFWVTSVSQPFSPANCAFVPDAGLITDKRLDSKPIIIGSGAVLSFKNNYNTEYDPPPNETFWDGWVLEVSTDDGATYRDFLDPLVGGSCVSGCYTGVITGIANNPISDRLAWCGNSGGYIDTVINLGSILNGQTIRLRFRIGTDEKLAAPGVRVDDIVITNASCP